MKKAIQYLILVIFLVIGTFLGMLLNIPPKVPQNVLPEEFSVQKELKHIRAIGQKPHSVGMKEHDRVRDYLIKELKVLGLKPEIQKTMSIRKWRQGNYRIAEVENIVTRLEGTANSKAIFLMAHYDSVPEGPGANDDGAGVAAILETLRAIKQGEPLKNDVIILLSDGEELGLMGAKAFYDEHAWRKEIGVVLNLEARGYYGTTFMFETGYEGAWTVKALKKAAPFPIANSVSNAIYQRMPNDTDFTIFKDKGFPGMNFAYIDHWYVYHKPIDDLEHLDERTLYHHGSTVFAVVKQFGNMNLEHYPKGNAVYFNILRSFMVLYSIKWVWIFTVFVALLLLGTIVLAFRKKRLTVKGLILGFFGLAVNTAIGIGVVTVLWKLVRLRYGAALDALAVYPDFRNTYLLGFVFLVMAVFALLYRLYAKWASISALSIGALLWWFIGMIACSIFLPEGSYLMTWPLLFGIFGLWTILKVKDSESVSFVRIFLLALLSVPVLIIFVPLFYSIIIAFSIQGWVFGLLGILLGLLVPHLGILRKKGFLWLTAGAALIGIVILAIGLFTLKAEDRPIQNSVYYIMDADKNEAVFRIYYLNDWTSQFIKDPEYDGREFKSKAPAISIEPPNLELLEESTENERRTLNLKLTSIRKAYSISVTVNSKTHIVSIEVNDKPIETHKLKKIPANNFYFDAIAPKDDGIELILTFDGTEPIEFVMRDQSYDLPEEVQFSKPPEHIMPRLITYIYKSFTF